MWAHPPAKLAWTTAAQLPVPQALAVIEDTSSMKNTEIVELLQCFDDVLGRWFNGMAKDDDGTI